MTYIDYLNQFNALLKVTYLPGSVRLLYYGLLAVFNEAGWPEFLQVDNYRLMSLVDTRTERVVISARDRLVQLGVIRYVKGKKHTPNIYSLCCFTPQKVSVSVSVSGSVSVSVSGSETVSVSGSETVCETVSHIKTKTKKEKTPSESKRKGEEFDQFWSSYPKKVGKQAAKKAFDSVNVPIETLLAAIERQKCSAQWSRDNGQYIPYPATWLNQERWEDELDQREEARSGEQQERYFTLADLPGKIS